MAGWVEGIRRALVLGLVLIAWTAIEQAPSVGPQVLYCHVPIVVNRISVVLVMYYIKYAVCVRVRYV